MSLNTWQETLVATSIDSTAITAAAETSCIHPTGLITIPPNWWYIGRMMKVTAHGRISCAVTTPGTARFKVKHAAIAVFDSGALNLNIVAKTSVPFWFECVLCCRTIGITTAATLFGFGQFASEAVIASPVPAVGGNGSLICPVGTPAAGVGFDSTIANIMDFTFTQTVATGSQQTHIYKVEALN